MLVVGGGNTGFQIAQEPSHAREVHLSIDRDAAAAANPGPDLFWYLRRPAWFGDGHVADRAADGWTGHADRSDATGPATSLWRAAERCRAVDAVGSTVSFDDGTTLDVATVIWATGFRIDHSWIHAPVFDESGRLVHRRGHRPAYFLGLSWQHTRARPCSAADDAGDIANQIDAFDTEPARTEPRAPERVA